MMLEDIIIVTTTTTTPNNNNNNNVNNVFPDIFQRSVLQPSLSLLQAPESTWPGDKVKPGEKVKVKHVKVEDLQVPV